MIEPGTGSAYSLFLEKTARLPIMLPKTQAHAEIFVGLITVVIIWILFLRSASGYQIEVVGLNPTATKYAGISVNRTIVPVMVLAGGLASLADASELI